MGATIRPLRDRIHIRRLEGHGIETVTPGGIVIPATTEARAKSKNDYFRAEVIGIGPDVRELAPGDHVLVHTWHDGDGSTLYTSGTFIGPDDVICAVAKDARIDHINARGTM
jgi:co-chaperonin GroES (HSP10)